MRFTPFAAVGAFAALASAQTFTECDPTKEDCPNNPAISAKFETDFAAGAEGVKGWKQTAGSLAYTEEGAQFTIAKQGDSPTIQTEGYLHFGRVEVKMKAAAGKGIISSIVLQSESLDEVDWEFIGTVDNKVQMNYFGKGNTTTYDRMIEAEVANVQEFHTYTLDWTSESLTYIIDGTPVRTLNYGDANGGNNYPQTPSTVRIGIWAGGDPGNEPGVIEWAGGETDFTKVPFTMTVASVKVENYSPGEEYKWTDKSGSFESIEVIGEGNVDGAPQNTAVLPPDATGTGGGVQSNINVPTATGEPATCSEATCSCDGIATVTITGPPPPPAVTPPPYPTTGIVTDTNPPPAPAYPTGSGVPPPPGNSTTPPFFPGAASTNQAGAAFVLVAAAAMLLI